MIPSGEIVKSRYDYNRGPIHHDEVCNDVHLFFPLENLLLLLHHRHPHLRIFTPSTSSLFEQESR